MKTNKNKTSVVVLTGAGAAIPWSAPSTHKITQKLCSDKTFRTRTGQPLGQWFLNKLRQFYHVDPDAVNFETILNSIDWLCSFYSAELRQGYSQFKTQLPAFFKSVDELSEVVDFDRIYPVKNNSWITENRRAHFYGGWNDIDYFFKDVYRYFINLIVEEIEAYEKGCLQGKFSDLNSSLNYFLNSVSKKFIVRSYTLNYDRVVPLVSELDFFEGFTSNSAGELKYDNTKVLMDYTCNSHYNLHGSIHHEQDWPGNVKLDPGKAIYNFGSGSSDTNDQESRKLINSNIITGLNKTSRIMQNPYSQFYHSFYNDCLKAETVYIFGYSFSDIHVNKGIIEGSKVNPNQKIKIAGFDMLKDEKFVNKFSKRMDLLSPAGRDCINILGEDHRMYNICSTEPLDRISYFRKGLTSYLKWKIWEKKPKL